MSKRVILGLRAKIKIIRMSMLRRYNKLLNISRSLTTNSNVIKSENPKYPAKVFSGIQPTGAIHIGNYLGAIKKWKDLQDAGNDVTFSIVDLHSITLPQDPKLLRENCFQMIASLLACGIDPLKSVLFLQSDVKEHAELGWILGCITTLPRLSHLPQFKEKSNKVKDIPLGLFVYPVLQAADILLYKATHVPVGEDQLQHLQLAQHLLKLFNNKFGCTFPNCHGLIADAACARIKSLRDPIKKMSKSDPDLKSVLFLTDTPDELVSKIKKAVTDFTSEVTYDMETRPGVSNLITIHSMVSNLSFEEIVANSQGIDTGRYKLIVADAVVNHFNPIRAKIDDYLLNKDYLCNVLEDGSNRAREIAVTTMSEVKDKIGLGCSKYSANMAKSYLNR